MGAGIDTSAEMETEMDESLKRVCANIKAAGIRVYTVAFDVDLAEYQGPARRRLRHRYVPLLRRGGSAELDAAFTAIAQDLTNLRLSK